MHNKNFVHIARRIEKLKFTNLLTNRKSVQKRKCSGLVKVFRDPEELTEGKWIRHEHIRQVQVHHLSGGKRVVGVQLYHQYYGF